MTTTELEPYAGGQIEQYQARMVMAPDDARALDGQLRACMTAVLREGTDYGVIPGTGGEKVLFRPGAQKLLQWFGLGFTCDRTEIDHDADGRKEGVTYRCTITKQLPDGRIVAVATCEGYAGYDEDRYYKTAEQVQRKAEESERFFAHRDKRPPRPTRWQRLPEYRAPWNTVIKMAQKRAIVGAAKDATAASGLFGDDPDDPAAQDPGERPAARQQQSADDGDWPEGAAARPAPDGRPWYDAAVKEAAAFTTEAAGQKLWRDAAAAARDGQCTPAQATHVQNLVTARIAARRKLAAATILQPLADDDPWRDKILDGLDSDDEARAALDELPPLVGAQTMDADRAELLARAIIARFPKAAVTAGAAGPGPDEPGSISDAQLTRLHTVLTGLGYGSQDREHKLVIAETITGHDPLDGPFPGRSSKNLSLSEARKLIDTLDGFSGDRDALIAYMAAREQDDGGSDA